MSNEQRGSRLIVSLLAEPYEAVGREVHEELQRAGFSDVHPAHLTVFNYVKPNGSRATELAEQAHATKQAMSYLVNYLESHGYIERAVDPADGRARIIQLTERGREVRAISRTVCQRIEASWAVALGEPQVQQLRNILQDVTSVIDRSRQDVSVTGIPA
jgi:DNA-binding MarR family transcriptional regulator